MEISFQGIMALLEKYEKDGQNLNIGEFEEFKREILSRLQNSSKIRFSKLSFYEIVDDKDNNIDEIPF